ncbi:MAG: hypothetical protein OCC46_03045 [Pseudodesulfovibrio sp.]
MSKVACLERIEAIYRADVDEVYSFKVGVEPITMLASQKGYWMQAADKPVQYKNAEAVFDALLAVEDLHEDDPLWSLHQNLGQLG